MNNKKITISHADLNQFTGTLCYFRYSPQLFPNFFLTDGCRYLAKEAGCYWLFDAIASCQNIPKIKAANIQFWQLDVAKDKSAVLTCKAEVDENGDDILTYSQHIPFADFPLDWVKIWVSHSETGEAHRLAMVPSEY